MIRRLRLVSDKDWRAELDLVQADPACRERVAARASVTVFKAGPLRAPAANILKQCMLAAGADAIVARGCIDASVETSMAIVFGTPRQLRLAAASLAGQPFGLPGLGEELLRLLEPVRRPRDLVLRSGTISFSNGPAVMGILNVTPDSFSDGGRYLDPAAAVDRALEMKSQGAAIVDVGAESTRFGSLRAPSAVQRERLVPVIRGIRRQDAGLPLSVDTSDPETAAAVIAEGVDMINDIAALSEPGMPEVAASTETPVVLMHMKGTPRDMQIAPEYLDVMGEVLSFLEERIEAACSAGIRRELILVDPGIGFGKRQVDNLALVRRLGELRCLGLPVLLGHSRKSFLGNAAGEVEPLRRDPATAVISALAAHDADILRVHDVPGTVQAVKVAMALNGGPPG